MTEARSNGWRKSTRSTNGDTCVEVRSSATGFEVRDSKLGDESPILFLCVADYEALLALAASSSTLIVQAGEFNVDEARWSRIRQGGETPGALEIASADNGTVALRLADQTAGDILVYNADEWNAFAEGARLGEFAPETWNAELVSA